MSQATDRDPSDQQAAAAAFQAWIAESRTSHDEADIAFEAALLDLGVLSPADVVEAFEPIDRNRAVLIALESGDSIVLHSTGLVTA